MNGQKATRWRKKIRKELRKKGLTKLGIARRSHNAALEAVQGLIRDKPRWCPSFLWTRIVDFVIPDITPALEAGVSANMEVRDELAE